MRIDRTTAGRGRWLGLGLALGIAAGCVHFERFQCQDDGDCIHEGTPGQCVLSEQTCIYPDTDCDTRWSTANGECMSPPGGDQGSSGGEGSATGSDPGATADEDSSGTTDEVPRDCMTGPYDDISEDGVVGASSVFSDNYHAFLASDGDYTTSWFSSGPENGGLPSIFEWEVLEPRCIARIDVHGNGLHSNPSFRENFGFESVIVRVFDQSEAVAFQQMLPMLGTPDPDLVIEPRVIGVRVQLELFEHESADCGGFSELEVAGF